MNEKQRILEAYKEVTGKVNEAGGIEGNWKPIAQVFNQIFSAFDRLGTLGALKDKKYGKTLRNIEDQLVTLADKLDKEFGPETGG